MAPNKAVRTMIKIKAKVNTTAAIEKIIARRAINNVNILAMIEAPQIAIVTPAIINKTKVIIFLPRK